jgi:hypothetical protein
VSRAREERGRTTHLQLCHVFKDLLAVLCDHGRVPEIELLREGLPDLLQHSLAFLLVSVLPRLRHPVVLVVQLARDDPNLGSDAVVRVGILLVVLVAVRALERAKVGLDLGVRVDHDRVRLRWLGPVHLCTHPVTSLCILDTQPETRSRVGISRERRSVCAEVGRRRLDPNAGDGDTRLDLGSSS